MRTPILSEPIVRDFVAYGRSRIVLAFMIVVIGAVLEAAGIMLLVPAIGLALGGGSAGWIGRQVVGTLQVLGADTPQAQLQAMVGVFLLIVALRFAVVLLRDTLLVRLEQDFVVDLRTRAFRRLAAMPWRHLSALRPGRVGHALVRDADRAANGVGACIAGATAVMMMIVQLTIALVLAPAITAFAAASGFAAFRILRRLRDRARRQGDVLSAEDYRLFETATEFLKGLKPAKAHGLESEYIAAFESAARRTSTAQRAFVRDRTLARLVLQSAAAVIAALAVVVGALWLATPVETLIIVVLILGRLYTPLVVIQQTAQDVRHAASGYRLARELAFAPEHLAAPSAPAVEVPAFDAAPEIRFCTATVLGDDADRPVLDRINCILAAGKVTVLSGASGAGKSTICDLAVGLLHPDEGAVLADGRPIEGEVLAALSRSVAYVGQEPFLLDESLRRNLCWGCGPLGDTEIYAALDTVGVSALVRKFEGGLDGIMRPDGMRFSGGERQRLRLARALLRRPRLLVLDEATGALDLAAEEQVLEAVLGARKGATVLVVSHRPGVLRFADHVIALDAGRVIVSGASGDAAAVPAGRV